MTKCNTCVNKDTSMKIEPCKSCILHLGYRNYEKYAVDETSTAIPKARMA
ncbi:unnamed protein product [marine sediment metagenome]|uniref:Uncharacterized protein n=1 Tax=marine sediment metagenome TaxID=412755 RepID=X0YC27_9ZZZZ